MDNKKEEQKYEQLRELGQELHMMIPETFLELEVLDKDGRVIQKHKQRGHSWTRNAYNMLFSQLAGVDGPDGLFGAGLLNIKDTTGIVRWLTNPIGLKTADSMSTTTSGYRAAAGEATRGILVGSGTNAESFEDYVLQTQIGEGAGAGQLNHAVSEAHALTYTPATKVFKNELARYFNNNSGGAIDVNEVALVVYALARNTLYKWVMSRDKLASTVSVPDTGQLKVTYTIQLTYPA